MVPGPPLETTDYSRGFSERRGKYKIKTDKEVNLCGGRGDVEKI